MASKLFSMLRFCDLVKSMICLTRGVLLDHAFSVGAISPPIGQILFLGNVWEKISDITVICGPPKSHII